VVNVIEQLIQLRELTDINKTILCAILESIMDSNKILQAHTYRNNDMKTDKEQEGNDICLKAVGRDQLTETEKQIQLETHRHKQAKKDRTNGKTSEQSNRQTQQEGNQRSHRD
jgi:hypothetical protein